MARATPANLLWRPYCGVAVGTKTEKIKRPRYMVSEVIDVLDTIRSSHMQPGKLFHRSLPRFSRRISGTKHILT